MTTSMNSNDNIETPKAAGGAFADALTFLRMLLMPLVVFLIWKGWQPVEAGGIDISLTVLAAILFAIAAITDVLDDYLGGNRRSVHRRFGYLDDIADTVLVIGTLAALAYVVHRAGWTTWTFLVPVVVLIGRELIVALFKGYELSRYIFPENWMGNVKSGLSMLGTCLLLSSPWLQVWIDRMRAGTENVADVFAATSPFIWVTGEVFLWVAAIFSILSAIKLFQTDVSAANDV